MASFESETKLNDSLTEDQEIDELLINKFNNSEVSMEDDKFFSKDILKDKWKVLLDSIEVISTNYKNIINSENNDESQKEIYIINQNFFNFKILVFIKIKEFIQYHLNFLEESVKDESLDFYFNSIFILQSYLRLIIGKLHYSLVDDIHISFPLITTLLNLNKDCFADEIWKLCIDYTYDGPSGPDRHDVRVISIQALIHDNIAEHDSKMRKSLEEVTEKDCLLQTENIRTYFSNHLQSTLQWGSADFTQLYKLRKMTKENTIFVNPYFEHLDNFCTDVITAQLHGFYDSLENENKLGSYNILKENKEVEFINIKKSGKIICLDDYISNTILKESYLKILNDESKHKIEDIMKTKHRVLALQTDLSILKTDLPLFIERIDDFMEKIKQINLKQNEMFEKSKNMNMNKELTTLLEKMMLGEKGYDPVSFMKKLSQM